jgi:hypothetical protein
MYHPNDLNVCKNFAQFKINSNYKEFNQNREVGVGRSFMKYINRLIFRIFLFIFGLYFHFSEIEVLCTFKINLKIQSKF